MSRSKKSDDHAARVAAHIKRVVDEAPPLTPEQRDKLRVLLRVPEGDDIQRSEPIELEIER